MNETKKRLNIWSTDSFLILQLAPEQGLKPMDQPSEIRQKKFHILSLICSIDSLLILQLAPEQGLKPIDQPSEIRQKEFNKPYL